MKCKSTDCCKCAFPGLAHGRSHVRAFTGASLSNDANNGHVTVTARDIAPFSMQGARAVHVLDSNWASRSQFSPLVPATSAQPVSAVFHAANAIISWSCSAIDECLQPVFSHWLVQLSRFAIQPCYAAQGRLGSHATPTCTHGGASVTTSLLPGTAGCPRLGQPLMHSSNPEASLAAHCAPAAAAPAAP